MARIDFHDPEVIIEISQDDESQDVVLVIQAEDDILRVSVGNFVENAEALAEQLERTLKVLRDDVIDQWETRPDWESDGMVSEGRDGYYVQLEGAPLKETPKEGYPSRDIATYELARAIVAFGVPPNTWYVNERGNTDPIHDEVRKYHDEGGTDMRPLEGVRFQPGESVHVSGGDWSSWVCIGDWGQLGLWLHTSGDPSVTAFLEGDDIGMAQPWPDEEDDEE